MQGHVAFFWFIFIFITRHQQLIDSLKTLIVITYAAAAVNALYVYTQQQQQHESIAITTPIMPADQTYT
jgi:hypothetical protein